MQFTRRATRTVPPPFHPALAEEKEGGRDGDWEKKKWRRAVSRERSKVEGGAAACDERLGEGRGEVLLSSLFSLRLDCSMSSTNVAAGVDSIISTYLHVKRLD